MKAAIFVTVLTFIPIPFLIRKRLLLSFFPTISWILFMCVPFLYSLEFFQKIKLQAIGIIIFLFAFFIGDYLSIKLKNKSTKLNTDNLFSRAKFLFFLCTLCFLIPIVHFILAGKPPIYSVIFDDVTLENIGELRYQYNRGAIPYWFSVLTNYVFSIFGPISFLFLFNKKFFIRASLLFVWVSIYAISSGAKGSLLIFLSAIFIVGLISGQLNRYELVSLLFVFLFAFTVISGMVLGHSAVKNKEMCPIPYGANFSPANVLRSCSLSNEISLNPLSDTLGYRLFLTPVEVSQNWYLHFSDSLNEKRSLSDVIARTNSQKTSNVIAQEYYAKFWPTKYSAKTNANTSIDADAFSIGGVFLIILFAIIIIFIRIVACLIHLKNTNLPKILDGLIIMFLTLLPAGGSIQSILIPQGLGVVILFYVLYKFIVLNNQKFILKL